MDATSTAVRADSQQWNCLVEDDDCDAADDGDYYYVVVMMLMIIMVTPHCR